MANDKNASLEINTSPIIVVHGGAGTHVRIAEDGELPSDIEQGVINAALKSYQLLLNGKSAVDAVEEAVVELENNPLFNAGRGSCLTNKGTIEMDASIMDGKTLQAGAVAVVSNVANPIRVARLVMEKTAHVMLAGEGATEFASKYGIDSVTTDKLVTSHAKERLLKQCELDETVKQRVKEIIPFETGNEKGKNEATKHSCQKCIVSDHDTVGAIALDMYGNLAFATSTGGITGKMAGRIGDSPIIGSGGYADNASCAVSTTGHGESFMKTCLARQIACLVENGVAVKDAAHRSLRTMQNRVGGDGGVICIDKSGEIAIDFISEGMSWAYVKNNELHSGIYPTDDRVKKL